MVDVPNSYNSARTQTTPAVSEYANVAIMNDVGQGNFFLANGNLITLSASQVPFKLAKNAWWKLCFLEISNDQSSLWLWSSLSC